MAEERKTFAVVLVIIALFFAGLFALWLFSIRGGIALTYTEVHRPTELMSFLDSRRQDIRGVKVNTHLLEIGKRPSLQIVRGYGQVMYLVRPYRQANLKFRNFTKAEVMDFCTNITDGAFQGLRSSMTSAPGPSPVWKGTHKGMNLLIVRVSRFTYLVAGLADRPVFMGQVELAKRLGMDNEKVLSAIIPAQDRWLEEFRSSPAFRASYPVQPFGDDQDQLIDWLGGTEE